MTMVKITEKPNALALACRPIPRSISHLYRTVSEYAENTNAIAKTGMKVIALTNKSFMMFSWS